MRVQLPMEEGDFEARARADRTRSVPRVSECPYPHRGTDRERCRECSQYCGVWLDGTREGAFVLCKLEGLSNAR